MPTYTDDFNRANENPATGWTDYVFGNAVKVESNGLAGSATSSGHLATFDAATGVGADQFAEVVLAEFDDAGAAELGAVLRSNGSTELYSFNAQRNGATTSVIFDLAEGINLATENATTWVATDRLIAVARGSALGLFRNGSWLLGATNAAPASGDPGVFCNTARPPQTPARIVWLRATSRSSRPSLARSPAGPVGT